VSFDSGVRQRACRTNDANFGIGTLGGLQASDERLSLQDSMTSQARAHSVTGLWLLQIGALAFVALGIFILVVDPDNWLVAFGSIVFFGLCAGFAARLLMLRRRAATGRP
jgi:hypothetical protein